HATSIFADSAGGLADHLSRSKITPEIAHGTAASAFNSEQTKHSTLYLECRRILHCRDAPDGGGVGLQLRVGSLRSSARRHDGLRRQHLCAQCGGLSDKFIPDAGG